MNPDIYKRVRCYLILVVDLPTWAIIAVCLLAWGHQYPWLAAVLPTLGIFAMVFEAALVDAVMHLIEEMYDRLRLLNTVTADIKHGN